MGLKLENKNGSLRFWDLVKRYSPLIASGLFSTASMALFLHYHELINLQWLELLLNINIILVPVYIIASNLLNGQAFYDKLAGTKLVKIEQNQTELTIPDAARPTS